MTEIRADEFLAALATMIPAVEQAVEAANIEMGADALANFRGTPAFQNRTHRLRAAMSEAPTVKGKPGRRVFVDPGAAGERKTPPHVYARFLNFGTRHIEPRRFAEDTIEFITGRYPAILERHVHGALHHG